MLGVIDLSLTLIPCTDGFASKDRLTALKL